MPRSPSRPVVHRPANHQSATKTCDMRSSTLPTFQSLLLLCCLKWIACLDMQIPFLSPPTSLRSSFACRVYWCVQWSWAEEPLVAPQQQPPLLFLPLSLEPRVKHGHVLHNLFVQHRQTCACFSHLDALLCLPRPPLPPQPARLLRQSQQPSSRARLGGGVRGSGAGGTEHRLRAPSALPARQALLQSSSAETRAWGGRDADQVHERSSRSWAREAGHRFSSAAMRPPDKRRRLLGRSEKLDQKIRPRPKPRFLHSSTSRVPSTWRRSPRGSAA